MLKILANLGKGVSIVIACALLLISYISMWDRTMGEINEFEKRKLEVAYGHNHDKKYARLPLPYIIWILMHFALVIVFFAWCWIF